MTGTIVADTSVVYGALDPLDADHARCSAALASGAPVIMPAPVIVEVDWVARSHRRSGATTALLGSVLDGSLVVINLDVEDIARAMQLVEQYETFRSSSSTPR